MATVTDFIQFIQNTSAVTCACMSFYKLFCNRLNCGSSKPFWISELSVLKRKFKTSSLHQHTTALNITNYLTAGPSLMPKKLFSSVKRHLRRTCWTRLVDVKYYCIKWNLTQNKSTGALCGDPRKLSHLRETLDCFDVWTGWLQWLRSPYKITSPAGAVHPGKVCSHSHMQWVLGRSKVPVDTDADLWGLSPDETALEFQHSSQIPHHTERQTEGGGLKHSLWAWAPSVLIKSLCYIHQIFYLHIQRMLMHFTHSQNIKHLLPFKSLGSVR